MSKCLKKALPTTLRHMLDSWTKQNVNTHIVHRRCFCGPEANTTQTETLESKNNSNKLSIEADTNSKQSIVENSDKQLVRQTEKEKTKHTLPYSVCLLTMQLKHNI